MTPPKDWKVINPDEIEDAVARGWNIDATIFDDDGNRDHKMLLQSSPGVCDFCSSDAGIVIVFETPAITSEMMFEGEDPDNLLPRLTMDASFTPDWNACAECAPLVRAHDVDGLWARVAERMGVTKDPEPVQDQLRFVLTGQHRAVIEHITGERAP